MMDAHMQPVIDAHYKLIADKLDGAQLFGQSIDTSDMKQMVIAAYYSGEVESRKRYDEYRALDQRLAGVTR